MSILARWPIRFFLITLLVWVSLLAGGWAGVALVEPTDHLTTFAPPAVVATVLALVALVPPVLLTLGWRWARDRWRKEKPPAPTG